MASVHSKPIRSYALYWRLWLNSNRLTEIWKGDFPNPIPQFKGYGEDDGVLGTLTTPIQPVIYITVTEVTKQESSRVTKIGFNHF